MVDNIASKRASWALIACLVSLGLTLAGGALLGPRAVRVLATQTWETTDGEVVTSVLHKSEATSGSDRPGSSGTTTKTVCADIEFVYTVEGKPYRSTTPTLFSDCSGARDLIERFPVGSRPRVYYSPSSPADAVLISDLRVADVSTLAGLPVALALSVLFFVAWLRPTLAARLSSWWHHASTQ